MLIEPDGKNDQGLSNRLQGGQACGKQNSFLVEKKKMNKICETALTPPDLVIFYFASNRVDLIGTNHKQ